MRRRLPLTVVLLLAVSFGGPPPTTSTPASEVDRIRAHLGGALSALREAEPTGLSAAQRAARAETVAWLEEYRAGGVFPHNHVRPGERVPVFVDPHGTPCAVGYLMLRSGERGLVEEIVRTNVLVRVPELAGHPGLEGWLHDRGLRLEEAALIQPMYGSEPTHPGPATRFDEATLRMTAFTALVSAYMTFTPPIPDEIELPGAVGIATVLGQAYLLAAVTISKPEPGSWQIPVNMAGTLVGGLATVYRFKRRAAMKAEGATVRPIVGAGKDGLTLGLSIRH